MRRGYLLIGCTMAPIFVTAVSLLFLIIRTTRYTGRAQRALEVGGSQEFPNLIQSQDAMRFRSPSGPLLAGLNANKMSIDRYPKEALMNFSDNAESTHYPWTHLYYGHFRRQLLEPGSARVSRSIAAGHEIAEIHHVLQHALMVIPNGTKTSGHGHRDCAGGRLRYLPGLGVQYEVYFRDRAARRSLDTRPADGNSTAKVLSSPSALNYHKVRVQRPLGELQVEYVGRTSNQLVHVILPYYNRLEALESFLERFVQLAQKPQPVALTIVRFSSGLPAMDADEKTRDQDRVRELVADAARTLEGAFVAPVRLLEDDGLFSAGRGWLTAAAATRDDGIIMLAHVDLLFGVGFLQRCRANVEPGARAYYPIVFSTYNPHVAYSVFKRKFHTVLENYKNGRLHREELGYWLDSDYGVSCQYLSDFSRFAHPFGGSVGPDLDIMLYERYVKSRVEVIRMPDPDLVQVYHKAICLRDMGKSVYNTCLKMKAMNEASKLEWGLWVYKNLGDTDEIKSFLEMVNKFGLPLPANEDLLTTSNVTKGVDT